MHSSRCAFSSLQTQHGLTFSPDAGFVELARLSGWSGWLTADNLVSGGCAGGDQEEEEPLDRVRLGDGVSVPGAGDAATGEDENQPIVADVDGREVLAQRGACGSDAWKS